jgi:hypothetical protein
MREEVGPPERFMKDSGLAKMSFGPPMILTSATSAFDLWALKVSPNLAATTSSNI